MSESESDGDRPQQKLKRPFGVTVIIFLQFVSILILEAELSGLLPAGLLPSMIPQWHLANTTLTLAVGMVVIIAQIIIAFGLWRLRRWAWFWIMIQLGADMVSNLWLYFTGQPTFPSMLINVAMVFYLNQHEVQQAFGQETREPV